MKGSTLQHLFEKVVVDARKGHGTPPYGFKTP